MLSNFIPSYGQYAHLVTNTSTDNGLADLYPSRKPGREGIGSLHSSRKSSVELTFPHDCISVNRKLLEEIFAGEEKCTGEERYVFVQLVHLREKFCLASTSEVARKNINDKFANGSPTAQRVLIRIGLRNDTNSKLGDLECFIPIALLREKFGAALENSPFVLSSSRGQILVSDWRVLLWPAPNIELTEAVLDVFLSGNLIDKWDEVQNSITEHFRKSVNALVQGQIFYVGASFGQITARVLHTEPTFQGFVNHATSLVLTRSDESQDSLSPQSLLTSPLSKRISTSLAMAPSIVVNPFMFVTPPRRLNRVSSGRTSPSIMSRRSSLQDSGTESQWPLFETHWEPQTGATFPLLIRETCECWTSLLPGFNDREIDPHSAIIIPVRALSQLKVVSGDWLLVQALGSEPKPPRWCQIFGVTQRQLSKAGLGITTGKDFALIDSILQFNLGAHETSELAMQKVTGASQPATATSITLARIPSPLSNQKALQNSIAVALRSHLAQATRLVCMGDVIPVIVDEATAQLQPKLVGDAELEDLHFSLSAPGARGLCFLKVTDLAAIPEEQSTSEQAVFALVQTGLVIDSASTKVVQTGIEHSCVPRGLRSFYRLKGCSTDDGPFRQLQSLVRSALDPRAADLDIHCSVLMYGPRGTGKAELVRGVADSLGMHLMEVPCYSWVEESDVKTQDNFGEWFNKASTYAPCIFALSHLEALAKKFSPSDVQQEPWLSTMFAALMHRLYAKRLPHPVVVVAMAESIENFPPGIVGSFRHEIQLEAPPEKARQAILNELTSQVALAADVSIKAIATETAALVANDLVDLVERAGGAALNRLGSAHARAGTAVLGADFDQALAQSRAQYSDSIGAPKIPNVTWDDVGGLASVKSDILDTIQLPLQHPELFTSGAKKRSGILLYGPPGTGKTLLAKAVATSCALNFFSVKGPELLNMYIGESEANVRRVFQKARDAKPCVIFFDELDSVAPKRGEQGDSGGVMDRIVSQLLAELDGMGDGGSVGEVFVIGATNRPDLLDPALLRPGRFDKMLYLGVSQDHGSQLNIIQALTRKFRLDPALDLGDIALQCPFHFTGADFYALCSDAMLKAMTRTANAIEDKVIPPMTVSYYLDHVALPEEIQVVVAKEDFEKALDELSPSVTPSELAHYQEIRQKFASQTLNGISDDITQEHPIPGSNGALQIQIRPSLPNDTPISNYATPKFQAPSPLPSKPQDLPEISELDPEDHHPSEQS
ncbi:peroxisomal assembly protein [Entomophthora muscae]|uniref:Peroxisomal assembly protein n=2 Tax=Entomophthora muscae TaxID=34485 RepID=A0ACC2S3M1_9FUNG|nr:peroxisomal assembly protein [Entomophthora muscae]